MRILLIGSGGREHALAWALAGSGENEILSTPGNPGMAAVGDVAGTGVGDLQGLVDLAVSRSVDLVVTGPEAPLVDGLADMLTRRGVPCFGPVKAGARLEGSKWFAKDVMNSAQVPTATGELFTDAGSAMEFMDGHPERFVIKADGLAAGKGVFLPDDVPGAEKVLEGLFGGSAGNAGATVVVEGRLIGPEVSILAVCSGSESVILPPSRDHKRAGDGDTGPNTGGMGAVCPPPGLEDGFRISVKKKIITPVLRELARRGIDYRGVLYAGLMLTDDGPRVLEFNVRFGDPEAQVVLPMLEGDLAGLLMAAAVGEDLPDIEVRHGYCSCVVMASGGYPGTYRKGYPVSGIDRVRDAMVFQAGTKLDDGRLITSGGRVLCVSAYGSTLEDSLDRAYRGVEEISFEGSWCRSDIGRTI